jgi:hemolysin III
VINTPATAYSGLPQLVPQVVADTVDDLLGRPSARGWIHLFSAATAVVAGAVLVSVAAIEASPKAGWAALVYAATIVAMFSVSAAYHRVQWRSARAHKWMKRLDHSMIFVFIAGCYTPIALLAMPPHIGTQVLAVVYVGAAAGVALKMLWPSAPRRVGVPLYLVLCGDLVRRTAAAQRRRACGGLTRRRSGLVQRGRHLLRF